MNKRQHEAAIFEAFLKLCPDFCGEEIVEWRQPEDANDFPDVICTTASKGKAGVELGEWLNEAEMRHAKGKERIEASILGAIGAQGDNATKNIYLVWLSPRPKARVKPDDAAAFREQLLRCIQDYDKRWPEERYWQSPQGHQATGKELEPYPVVAKYLDGIRFFPSHRYRGWPPKGALERETWPAGNDWILFPARGGAYSEQTMLQPLLELLAEKKEHYGALAGFQHLSLVVYYNSALLYNSPAETPRFTFESAAKEAAEFMGDDAAPFSSVYLFVAVDDGRVYKVC